MLTLKYCKNRILDGREFFERCERKGETFLDLIRTGIIYPCVIVFLNQKSSFYSDSLYRWITIDQKILIPIFREKDYNICLFGPERDLVVRFYTQRGHN